MAARVFATSLSELCRAAAIFQLTTRTRDGRGAPDSQPPRGGVIRTRPSGPASSAGRAGRWHALTTISRHANGRRMNLALHIAAPDFVAPGGPRVSEPEGKEQQIVASLVDVTE